MRTIKHTFALTALAAAMLIAYGATAAEDEDAVDLTPLTTAESNFSLGFGHYSGDREQFGMFDGVQDDESVLTMDGNVLMRDDATGTWITATGRNLGLDSREATLGYERQGDWGVKLLYNNLPRFAPYTVNTGLTGIGTDYQIVADDGIALGAGTDVRLGTERESVGINLFKYLTPQLNFKVDFKNEEKDGTRHWGRGGQPEFMVEPIDWTTRQMEMTLNYAGKEFQVSGGYNGSTYSNANSLVYSRHREDADTPANQIYLSLPLDNQAHQLFVDGGYNFTPTARGTFKASYTRATQNERMPTADIVGLPDPVAPTNLDGEINTTLLQLGFTARPLPELNVLANLRYHDMDDQTPVWLVVNTGTTTITQVHTTPLSYETLTGKLEGTYRLPANFSVIAGIDRKNQDRTVPYGNDINGNGYDDERYVPFRAELDETTYRLQLRRSLTETLNGSVAFLHSKRDGSEYSEAQHSEGGINPVNIADRDRDKWRLTLDWMPVDRLGVQFNFEDATDDYGPGSNEYGLLEGKARMYSLDADFSVSDEWQLTGWYSHDDNKAEQFNGRWDRTTEDHEIDKFSRLTDKGDSIGLGLRGRPSGKLTVGTDLQLTRTTSRYNDTVIPIGENGDPDIGYPTGITPLPDIKNRMIKVGLFTEYALRKNADLRVDLVHERWRTDDWTWQFSDGSPFIYGSGSGGTLDGTSVIQDSNQSASFIGVRYIFKFR